MRRNAGARQSRFRGLWLPSRMPWSLSRFRCFAFSRSQTVGQSVRFGFLMNMHIVKQTERAVIAAVYPQGADIEAELAELRELVATAGAEIAAEVTQERAQPHPVTYLGKGKLDELLGVVK